MRAKILTGIGTPAPLWLYLSEKEAEKTPLISEAKASLGESREVWGNIMELRDAIVSKKCSFFEHCSKGL